MQIIFTTCPNFDEAESLAEKIVDQRLAACVQILPQITSVYLWDDKVQKEPEHLLLIKTLSEKWEQLQRLIVKEHSYSVPEIAAVDAERVSEFYLKWMRNVLEN